MGKKIDFFVLTAGITVGFYLYFRSAFDSPAICIGLALLCGGMIRRFMRGLVHRIGNSAYMRRRQLRKCARSAMMHLACMDADEARKRLQDLIIKSYGGDHEIALIQLHPSSVLDQDAVFSLWKAHSGKETLVICATAQASSACKAMAAELKQPKVALIDSGALSQLIAGHPDGFFPPEEKQARRKLRLRRLGGLFINRKNAPKCLMMFFSMLMIYLFSANIFYLAAALFLLLIGLLSLHSPQRPAKLF